MKSIHSWRLCNLNTAHTKKSIVQNCYTEDPAPPLIDDRVYLFTGRDNDGSKNYDMREWLIFSSANTVNWQHHGSLKSIGILAWASAKAWAGQVISRNGKYYFYVPVTSHEEVI
ncbi:hypothetical protein CORC01_04244 [Colletotrichum orchidophilum]|uniref:Glycosyl hydrolase family 43 n=1 Tax=Colletotrichum orchidophilum TaxID=1209926 RepID=A0A1G4BGI3_9PEZI|nr:uncharacterized protein CORC01_04244 [Colletotrichum orchidophilum]OHF00494.1 hypothetical protein CORC01_04244 [Colletotrichum orchidophilum]